MVDMSKYEVALDIGTSTTRIFAKGQGVVMRQPTLLLYSGSGAKPIAAGDRAAALYGCTPEMYTAARPVRCGVVTDIEQVKSMLRQFFKSSGVQPRARVTVGARPDLTQLQKRSVQAALPYARAAFIRQPIASALGAGADINTPRACCVVDIGAGSTDIGILSCGGMIESEAIDVAGDAMDLAITNYVRGAYGMFITPRMAERVKMQLGSASKPYIGRMEARGREAQTGFACSHTLSGEEVARVLERPSAAIVNAIVSVIEKLPHDAAGDLLQTGITLTGGGALLHGLAERIAAETGLPVRTAQLPFDCAINGMAKAMEAAAKLRIA